MERVVPLANKLLEENGSILLVCHENPDGDTLGSALALYIFLKKLNKDVYVFCKDNIPKFAQFLPRVNEVLHPKDLEGKTFDLAIIVDASDFKRATFEISSHLKARIDHHVGGDFYGLYDFIDFTCASTTLLVYELLKYINKDLIDKDIALCLYTGLCTDTGFFRYSNTTKEVFDAASSLCAYGVEPNYIWKNLEKKRA
jgi:phosphoesterase RecJ-like protein